MSYEICVRKSLFCPKTTFRQNHCLPVNVQTRSFGIMCIGQKKKINCLNELIGQSNRRHVWHRWNLISTKGEMLCFEDSLLGQGPGTLETMIQTGMMHHIKNHLKVGQEVGLWTDKHTYSYGLFLKTGSRHKKHLTTYTYTFVNERFQLLSFNQFEQFIYLFIFKKHFQFIFKTNVWKLTEKMSLLSTRIKSATNLFYQHKVLRVYNILFL